MITLANMPDVLTVEEAASVLRIGRSAAYSAAKSGDLPAIRIGRKLRVPRHKLAHMLGLINDDDPAGAGPKPKDVTRCPPKQDNLSIAVPQAAPFHSSTLNYPAARCAGSSS